ncbi:gustatory receptor 58c [Haematobia irritans]|uniref:gustatory receptor 58c n=1 Tax=Haematobia irritans TaxID=7368 RepID=UPI003F4FA808
MSQTAPLTLNPVLKHMFYVALLVTQLFGLLNLTFDYKNKTFSPKGSLVKIYCGSLHCIYCVLLPFAFASPYSEQMAFMQRRFYVRLNHVVMLLKLPSLLFTLMGIWKHSGRLYQVIRRFENIRAKYFHRLSESKRNEILKKNDRLLWLKIISAISLLVMFYVRTSMFLRNPSWQYIGLSIYFGCLECLTIYNMNFFFCGMCYVNCAMHYVLGKLLENEIHEISIDTKDLSKLFREICYLSRELMDIFQWQLLTIMLADMVALISLFFNIITWWYTSEEGNVLKIPILLLILQTSLINIAEIFIIAYVCYDTKLCWRVIRENLFEIGEKSLTANDKLEERSLELFSLEMCVYPNTTNICGFFELDMRTAFNFLQATAINLIILVQFDLKTW